MYQNNSDNKILEHSLVPSSTVSAMGEVAVYLPESVEQWLNRICVEKNQTQPEANVRRRLASIGEQLSLELLQQIYYGKPIKTTLTRYINYLLDKPEYNSSSSSHSPSKSVRTSLFQTPSSSPCITPSPPPPAAWVVPLFASPQGETVTGRSPVVEKLGYNGQQSPYSSASPSKPVRASPYHSHSASITPVRLHMSPNGETATRSPLLQQHEGHTQARLEALSELEFRKQFLLLSYGGGMTLNNVITAEDIRSWKNLPIRAFEAKVWEVMGQKCIDKKDRRLAVDWDSRKTHIYHCYVSKDGRYIFKGPFINKAKTHLQKVLGDDNVLMVKFAGEVTETGPSTRYNNNYATYSKVAREGILVGLRHYRFFVFKDGGNKEKTKSPMSSAVKCYFVRVDSGSYIDRENNYKLSNRTIYQARCAFMHAHTLPTVANYMSRFSLILSKTISLQVDLTLVNVDHIDENFCLDEYGNHIYRDGKPLIHTDGTGFISEDLALLCPRNLSQGECKSNEQIERLTNPDKLEAKVREKKHPSSRTREPPLLIQFRLFYNGYAVKGTVLVNKKLPPKTIQIRPSMIKVYADHKISEDQTVNSLEVIGTSNSPGKTVLSRNLIALLSHGGVLKDYFLDILMKALEDANDVFYNKRAALRVATNHGEKMDHNYNVARMILCGIPLEESYLQYRLSILMREEKKSLRKGKLHIPECYYLMGTTDPTGILEKDEVCVILDNGHMSGKVLVYRNPGIHFGDIHVLKATYVKEMESYVGNAKYAIFFSRKGPRSVADEMGGGDFDGDLYWVSRNPELLKYFKPSEPWVPTSSTPKPADLSNKSKKPNDLSKEDLEDELIKLFLTTRFEPSFAISEAADNWLAMMDRFLTLGDGNEKNRVKANILRLVDIYYDALDAPKKGTKVEVPKELKVQKFPHYMEKKDSYTSTSVLGLIYDTVNAYQKEDPSTKEVEKLSAFDVEVPENCLNKWKAHFQQYRSEMSSALQEDNQNEKKGAAEEVIRKYKRILYDAEEFEECRRDMDEVFNEAVAIYHLVYDWAKSADQCSFAWKVAGPALFKFYAKQLSKQGESPFIISPSVLKEVM